MQINTWIPDLPTSSGEGSVLLIKHEICCNLFSLVRQFYLAHFDPNTGSISLLVGYEFTLYFFSLITTLTNFAAVIIIRSASSTYIIPTCHLSII